MQCLSWSLLTALQSDSEPETRGGVMKPTISSQNKVNTASSNSGRAGNKGGAFGAPRRRGMQNSYSSINLTSAGQDDSSSEETTVVQAPPSGKPAVPPRPRNLSGDHKRSNLKQNNLNDTEVPCKDNDNSDCESHFFLFFIPPFFLEKMLNYPPLRCFKVVLWVVLMCINL